MDERFQRVLLLLTRCWRLREALEMRKKGWKMRLQAESLGNLNDEEERKGKSKALTGYDESHQKA